MIVIRREQMEALSKASQRDFESRMIKHLKEFFPEECRRAGDERVLAAIRQGIVRAATYGITMEADVARYIDLSVVLGLDFDSGRRWPWAKTILNKPDLTPATKLWALMDQTRRAAAAGKLPGAKKPRA